MELEAAKMIGAGLAAIALAGAGVGIGIIFGNYLSGAMRNPSAAQKQFPNLLLGFALAEAVLNLMVRKYFFQLIFLYLFFSKEVFAAESGGMPQLDPEFWVSQIFWLTLVFGTLYIVLSKLILPKISANLELRKSQIQENIEAADKQRKDSELKLKEYDDIILKSKLESKNLFNETREKTLKNINIKRDTLEKQIDEEIKKAETEIDQLKHLQRYLKI